MKLIRDAIKRHVESQALLTAAFRAEAVYWAKRKGRKLAYYDVMGIQWFETTFSGKSVSVYQTSYLEEDTLKEVYYSAMPTKASKFFAALVRLLDAYDDLQNYGLDFGECFAYDENGVELKTEDRSDKQHTEEPPY